MTSKTIISFETSSNICSVAIVKGNKVLNSINDFRSRKHAEILPEVTKKVLKESNLTINSLDGIAVSIGPGSFTGLRIGLGFSKGLAYARSLPIIPVPSLLGLAFTLNKKEPKSGITYSHAKKVFFQEFKWANGIPYILGKAVVGDYEQYIDKLDRGFHYNCSSIIEHENTMHEVVPDSRSIGLLGAIFFSKWCVKNTYELTSDYIAPFEINSNGK